MGRGGVEDGVCVCVGRRGVGVGDKSMCAHTYAGVG
jgi:hypothetical protein